MTRWTMSAVACAVSMVFAAPLWAQTPSPADQSKSPATTSAAPTTPPPQGTETTPSACAGLTGTARTDCLNHENAANALCFGMNENARANCVKSYYPDDARAKAASPDAAQPSPNQSSPSRSEAPAGYGMSGNADRGTSGSTPTGGEGGRSIQK